MSARRPGVFVVLEGIDGSGKSTQAALLDRWLGATGIPHLLVREPGGTPVGEEVRRIVLQDGEVPPRSELLLMLTARAALCAQRIRPALARGEVVVGDRFDLSTLAYQGHGRGLPLDEVRRLNEFATEGLRPDLTILLEVGSEVAEARQRAGGGAEDRIESGGADFRRRVREAYSLLATQLPGIERVSAGGSVDEVHREIRRLLEARFPETFPQGEGF